MKLYTWMGKGYSQDATVIVIADCMKSAREMIEKALIDDGLHSSWEESQDIEESEIHDCKIVYFNNGDS